MVLEHDDEEDRRRALKAGADDYLVGPLARYGLHADRLHPAAAEAARAAGLGPECRNPFRSIIVRAVEVVHAFATAIELLDGVRPQRGDGSTIDTSIVGSVNLTIRPPGGGEVDYAGSFSLSKQPPLMPSLELSDLD